MPTEASELDGLTERQLECLRLVREQLSSKEIARQLNISHHSVDKRLQRAMRTLGVSSRRDAALIACSADTPQTCQQLAYQPEEVACEDAIHHPSERLDQKHSDFGTQHALREETAVFESQVDAGIFANVLRRKDEGETSNLSVSQRAVIVVLLMIGIPIAFSGLVSALETLSRISN